MTSIKIHQNTRMPQDLNTSTSSFLVIFN